MATRKPIFEKWIKQPSPGEVIALQRGAIICADAKEFLRSLKPGVADVIFLDPPFNLGKVYGRRGARADRLPAEEYQEFMAEIIALAIAALKKGGALWLYHIPRWAIPLAATIGQFLQFQHWVAVSMKNGFARGSRLYPAHYALLHYSKGLPSVLRRPKVEPLTCPHCGEFVKDYGGYRHLVEDGVNLSDVWDDVSPVRHKKYKTRVANELPLVVGRRVIEISGVQGGLLVDPFAGSGSVLVGARRAGMYALGCDRERANVRAIAQRLNGLSAKRAGEG